MPAADSTAHIPPPVNGPGDAAVIDISTRVSRQPGRERWKPVSDHPGPGDKSTQAALAERYEELFNQRNMTLTDDQTAETYTVTLDLVLGILKAAQAQGIVDEGQQRELHAMIEGMKAAPQLL